MAHVRKQIRDWLKINLAGSADAGPRVLVRRTLPLEKNLSPTFVIAVLDEGSTDVSSDGDQDRMTRVRVTACAKGSAEATEDILDRMGVFAEGVFASDPTLGGLVSTYEYQSTEFGFVGEGEQTFCTAAFTFSVAYLTRRDDPENTL